MLGAPISSADAAALVNPVLTREDWGAMRSAVLADPGAFHSDIAARTVHWFIADIGGSGAWVCRGDNGLWSGWDAETGDALNADFASDFAPWTMAFDASEPPHWRWFVGGRTNACFNEVDRHVLS